MGKKLVPAHQNGLHITIDNMPELQAALKALARDEVLVGIPEDKTERPPDGEGKPDPATNAALAYIHDNGAPEANIPARPFMIPGIEKVQDKNVAVLVAMAQYALQGAPATKIREGFERIGLQTQLSIQRTIQDGIPPPLADRTLKARAKKGRKGAKEELERRGQGYAAGIDLARPLIDTGEMLKKISYVVRRRKKET